MSLVRLMGIVGIARELIVFGSESFDDFVKIIYLCVFGLKCFLELYCGILGV